MDVPIGINVKGTITGLDISYEYSNDALTKMHQLGKMETASVQSSLTANSMSRKRMSSLNANKFVKSRNTINVDKNMRLIEFKDVKVNKYYTFKFILKNLCGITTTFKFKSKNFSPGIEKDLKFEMQNKHKENINQNNNNLLINNENNNENNNNNTYNNSNSNRISIDNFNNINNNNFLRISEGNMNSNTLQKLKTNSTIEFNNSNSNSINNMSNRNTNINNNHINNNNLTNKKSTISLNNLRHSQILQKKITIDNIISHPLLNEDHEQIIFTSNKGIEHTRLKQLEKESLMYLSNKKGVALLIEPNQGRLDPYSEVHVLITVYNECVGDFEDELISQVKGLPERKFPISIRIRGNPLQLAPFQTGIDFKEDPPVMNLGNVICKINYIQKSFKVINTGANLIMLDWKVYDYHRILFPAKDKNLFKVKIVENKNNFSLKYIPCEPEEFSKSDEKFTIEPNNYLIQPKGFKDFNVKFKTNESGISSALVVAYPKFMDNYTSNVGLSELAIKIDGNGVNPVLYVDKTVSFFVFFNFFVKIFVKNLFILLKIFFLFFNYLFN